MTVWPLDFPSLATKGHQKCYREKCLFSLNFVLLHFAVDAFHTFSHSNSLSPLSHSSLPSHSHHLTFYVSVPINFSLMMFFTFLSSFFITNLLTLSLSLTHSLSLSDSSFFLSRMHTDPLSLSHHSSSQVLIEQTWST